MKRSATPLAINMAVHFSNEAPDDQFYTDFGNLNKFQDTVSRKRAPDISETFSHFVVHVWQAFQKLLSLVIEFLMAPQSVRVYFSFPWLLYLLLWEFFHVLGGWVRFVRGTSSCPSWRRLQRRTPWALVHSRTWSRPFLSYPLKPLPIQLPSVLIATSLTPLHFFKAAMKKNLSPAYVKEDLMQLGKCVAKTLHAAVAFWGCTPSLLLFPTCVLKQPGLSEERSSWVASQVSQACIY